MEQLIIGARCYVNSIWCAKQVRENDACFAVFFFQAEDGIRDLTVTGVQTCALPISTAGCAHRQRSYRHLRRTELSQQVRVHDASIQLARRSAQRVKSESAEVRRRARSEERRVGKEGRSRWSPYH